MRPFADIDLLVHEQQIDAAKDVLTKCGYLLAPELISEKLARRFHINLPFVRSGPPPVHVELHWRLTDHFTRDQLPVEEFWRRARPFERAFTLSLEDEIAYLATHLDKHGYFNQALAGEPAWIMEELSANRLIWFTDLHELISRHQVEWPAIENSAAITSSLTLLHHLLGTAGIPERFLIMPPARWSKRFAFRLAKFAARDERRRNFFRRHILATRKGFELRLVRLLDLWNFIFPRHGGSIGQSLRAGAQCLSLFFALLALRIRRR